MRVTPLLIDVGHEVNRILGWSGWPHIGAFLLVSVPIAVAAWAAWQSKRAADGTRATAKLMNQQWTEERHERLQVRYERRKNALVAIRTEIAAGDAVLKGNGLPKPFGSWVYCRDEVAHSFPETAALIDALNLHLLTLERRLDDLSRHSLLPPPKPTGAYSSSPPMGGVDSLIGYRDRYGPQLAQAVTMLDANLATLEAEYRKANAPLAPVE